MKHLLERINNRPPLKNGVKDLRTDRAPSSFVCGPSSVVWTYESQRRGIDVNRLLETILYPEGE